MAEAAETTPRPRGAAFPSAAASIPRRDVDDSLEGNLARLAVTQAQAPRPETESRVEELERVQAAAVRALASTRADGYIHNMVSDCTMPR